MEVQFIIAKFGTPIFQSGIMDEIRSAERERLREIHQTLGLTTGESITLADIGLLGGVTIQDITIVLTNIPDLIQSPGYQTNLLPIALA